MRSFVPRFDCRSAKNLREALKIMSQEKVTPIAGGTDLMVFFNAGKLKVQKFLDISAVKEFKKPQSFKNHVSLSPMTTYSDVLQNKVLQKKFPNLCIAAKETGAIAIQNRGTLAGNIVNASPIADSVPALMAYNAVIELTNLKETRLVNLDEFYLDYRKTQIKKDELVTRILLPDAPKNMREFHFYKKIGTRKAQAISKVCCAVYAKLDSKKRIVSFRCVLGGVAAITLLIKNVESFVVGKLAKEIDVDLVVKTLKETLKPISDIRSTAEYRLHVASKLVEEALIQLKQKK